jgi:uncharacterized membrane protein YozB (DUF420 family)
MELSNFPPLNACLNGLASVFLIAGYIQIKRGNKQAHRNCMIGALIASTLFLGCYLYYHYSMQRLHGEAHTKFVKPEWFRPFYLAILFTHLVGAFAIVPMVLMTVSRAFRGRFEAHKKIARWTWPVWMYVSATGVLIYFLLYQIFPQR